jgi:hypothetical protein
VFLSNAFLSKQWTVFETRPAAASAGVDRSFVILPIRLDDSEPPPLLRTIAWVDARQLSAEAIADLVAVRLAATVEAPKPGRNVEKRIYHVISRGDGWAVTMAGESEPIEIYSSKEAAVAYGYKLIEQGSVGELIVHSRDGSVEQRMGGGAPAE